MKGAILTNDCLREAIVNLNKHLIDILLDNGIDINSSISFTGTPFRCLVSHIGNLQENGKINLQKKAQDLLVYLIEKGANPLDKEDKHDSLGYLNYYIKNEVFRNEIRTYILQITPKTT